MMTMDTSSPLAALQPPSFSNSHWAHAARPSAPTVALDFSSNTSFLRPPPCKPADFNFRDMGMRKSHSDYFSFNPARGSSPTQSLAVDLSQNFHIDQSPQLPTPRRALFTTALAANRKECVITPPVPSSSPGPDGDPMEFSPLPHKPPARPLPQQLQIQISSPIKEPIPPFPQLWPACELRRAESQPERFESLRPTRPGVRKAQSSAQLPPRRPKTSDHSRTPFWFGAISTTARAPLESFAESPPSEQKVPTSMSNPSLIVEPLHAAFSGSPVANPIPRRPAVGRLRSGIGRRTMSMQDNGSSKVIRAEKKRCCTTGSMSNIYRDRHALKLPHIKPVDDDDALPRISKETLADVLAGKYSADVGEFLVIDCRFEYEYSGGHIACALNFNSKEEVERRLFQKEADMPVSDQELPRRKVLIFHCEYSEYRAPLMAKHIRRHDRLVNQNHYPQLTYSEVYILDGGYHGFFKDYPNHCYPQSYVEMGAKEHENACELGLAKVKGRGRAKLSRAQTYAFGQHASMISPLPAAHSSTSLTIDAMDVDFNSPIELRADPPMDYISHSSTHPYLVHELTLAVNKNLPPLPRRFDTY